MRTAKEDGPASKERLDVIRHVSEPLPDKISNARLSTEPREGSFKGIAHCNSPSFAVTGLGGNKFCGILKLPTVRGFLRRHGQWLNWEPSYQERHFLQ